MDPLSEVLFAVRVRGGVFLSAHFTAPWAVGASMAPADCAAFMGTPAQVIGYHVVAEGRMLVMLEDEAPLEVAAGEIVLFPRNDPHILASEEGLKPIPVRNLVQRPPEGELTQLSYGGGGAATRIICGFLASDDTSNPLMLTLPRTMKIDVREGASRAWIEASVRFAAGELTEGRLASSSVISRLSETLLTEAVRQYSASHGSENQGWLKGLKDPQVGRALALMHQKPSAPWSAESLASEIGLSRSAFADRFTSLVGMPPMRYLTVLRLQTAKMNMRETSKTIAQLAYAAGYESGEAFSRAFKREFGLSPVQWREQSDSVN